MRNGPPVLRRSLERLRVAAQPTHTFAKSEADTLPPTTMAMKRTSTVEYDET
jgi:hypothetical protein